MRTRRTEAPVRSRTSKLAAGLALLTLLVAASLPAAGQAPLGSYVATAAASGLSVNYRLADFIAVEEFVDAAGPTAQSHLDPNGSSSFASLPYPGSTVLAYQGILSLAGIDPPQVDYPLYVSADHPGTPAAAMSDPTGLYSIDAAAEAGRTTAQARAGQTDQAQSSGTVASTDVTVDDDTITVVARTLVTGLSTADGLVRASTIRSSSTTTYVAGDEAPTTETELAIDGLIVAGVPVSLTPEGLQLGTGLVPTPGADVDSQLAALLEPSGITIEVLAAQPTTGGARAPVFRLTAITPETPAAPGAGSIPAGVFTFDVGGAATSLTVGDAVAAGPATAPEATAPLPTSTPAPASPAPASAAPAGPAPTVPASTATPGGASDVALPSALDGALPPARARRTADVLRDRRGRRRPGWRRHVALATARWRSTQVGPAVTTRTMVLRRSGLAVAAGGAVAVALGWVGIADAELLPDQVAFFASGAVLGVAALGGGLALLVTASLGAEADRLDRVLEAVQPRAGSSTGSHVTGPNDGREGANDE